MAKKHNASISSGRARVLANVHPARRIRRITGNEGILHMDADLRRALRDAVPRRRSIGGRIYARGEQRPKRKASQTGGAVRLPAPKRRFAPALARPGAASEVKYGSQQADSGPGPNSALQRTPGSPAIRSSKYTGWAIRSAERGMAKLRGPEFPRRKQAKSSTGFRLYRKARALPNFEFYICALAISH